MYGSQVRALARALFDLRGGHQDSLAVERGAGGLELEDSAAFAFRGRQYEYLKGRALIATPPVLWRLPRPKEANISSHMYCAKTRR
eukprot:6331357-Pyramimonas_sp.AAC.2